MPTLQIISILLNFKINEIKKENKAVLILFFSSIEKREHRRL